MAGFVAFALADQRFSALLMLHYGVDLLGWFTAMLWVLAALSAAALANHRAFQLVMPPGKRIFLRGILVSSAAGVYFCFGFLATINIDY